MFINALFYWRLIANTTIFSFLLILSIIFNILITGTSYSCSTTSLLSFLSLFNSVVSTEHNLQVFFSSLSPSLYRKFTPFLSPTPPSWQLHQAAHHHDVTTVHIYKSCSISSLSNPRKLTGFWVPFIHYFIFPSGIHFYLRFDHLFSLTLPF
jgi:hypothetical protein